VAGDTTQWLDPVSHSTRNGTTGAVSPDKWRTLRERLLAGESDEGP